jgi:hypothetical protein
MGLTRMFCPTRRTVPSLTGVAVGTHRVAECLAAAFACCLSLEMCNLPDVHQEVSSCLALVDGEQD